MKESTITVDDFSTFEHTVFMMFPGNHISHAFTCKLILNNLLMLNLSFNIIREIHEQNFNCLPFLSNLLLNNNDIEILNNPIFKGMSSLRVLDLSSNEMYFVSKSVFCGLNSLELLRISNNKILFVDRAAFIDVKISVILTDVFHICCLCKECATICTSIPAWPSSCASMISTSGEKQLIWLFGVFVTVSNILSGGQKFRAYHKTKELNDFDLHVARINVCDLITGIYLLIMSSIDAAFGEAYVSMDLSWRKSIPCHAVAYTSLLFVLLSGLFLLAISISRYKAIKDPFNKSLKRSVHRMLVYFIPICLACLISFVIFLRVEVEGFEHLSSPLCVLFGKTDKSTVQLITTVFVSLYLLTVFVAIMIIYFKMLTLNKSSQVVSEEMMLKRQRTMTRHVILAGASNAICWIPSAVFFLVSCFIDKFPVVWLYIITLVVLPINSALNPIIFNLSDIQKYFERNKQRVLTFLCDDC